MVEQGKEGCSKVNSYLEQLKQDVVEVAQGLKGHGE